ncbi:succinylglutamate desuccinylase [bacterium]|nr:succinylglutamate desuccinylase [bacterium]
MRFVLLRQLKVALPKSTVSIREQERRVVTLRTFSFTGGAHEAGLHLLVTGGVHGDEFEPIAAIRRLIGLFNARDERVAGFRGRVTFVPIVNEAAFLRGHRCADDGLDLARTCPGKPDGTVTEQTAFALSELIRAAGCYIDLHTGGTELSVFPLAGYTLHPNADVLAIQRRMARAFNLPVIWGTAANLDGRSLSIARDAGVPAIYCEYLGSSTCSADGIDAYVKGSLNVMSELEMLDREFPASRVEHVIENSAPGSGHMQVCNPSPVDGFFESAVRLGDQVRAGELLGHVYPLAGEPAAEICADVDGLVLVLRTFPRVHAGESVGVVAAR